MLNRSLESGERSTRDSVELGEQRAGRKASAQRLLPKPALQQLLFIFFH